MVLTSGSWGVTKGKLTLTNIRLTKLSGEQIGLTKRCPQLAPEQSKAVGP
jgi:hypothetical protein